MKTKTIIAVTFLSATALGSLAGVEVGIQIGVPAPPPVVIETRPAVTVIYPETYVWDGYEYVGYVNGSYVYLSGEVWLPLPGERLVRFHEWERVHADWRAHAIHNEHHRGPAPAHHEKPDHHGHGRK